jgi:spore coat protein U-like protein
MSIRTRSLWALMAATLLAGASAQANVTGSLSVQLQLENGCIVTGSEDPFSSMNFGTMDFGDNPSAGVRRMASGVNYVEYRLFTLPNGGGVEYALGGGPLDLSAVVPGANVAFELPIYGVVAPQAGLVAGNYSDLVSITLTF